MKMRFKSCWGLAFVFLSTTFAQAAEADYQAIITREFGTAVNEMTAIEKEIKTAKPEQYPQIEERLLGILDAPGATMPGKQFACQMLVLVGSPKCVPAVSKLLTDEKLSHIARVVLLGLRDSAADAALRNALGQTQGNLRIGIINSIGDRAESASVSAVAALVAGTDEATARAALNAIGKMGGAPGADALEAAKVPEALKQAWGDAYLRCAGSLAASDSARAEKMYRSLFEGNNAIALRAAAFVGIAQVQKEQAVPLIMKTLSSPEVQLRRVAVGAVISVPGNSATKAFAKELAGLAPETKVVMLGALAARGDAAGLTAMINQLASDENQLVRGAALKALGRLGDFSSVSVLAAALRQPDNAATAKETLINLNGAGVGEALAKEADGGDAAIRPAVLGIVAERHQVEALPAIRKAIIDQDAKIRQAGLKALALLGTQEDLNKLTEMLVAAKDDGTRDDIAEAMSEVGGRVGDKAARVNTVAAAWDKADNATKVRLLRVLWSLGGDKALATTRSALAGEADLRKAAVKTLAEWPDAAPMPDLLAVAKSDKETSLQIVALRGYIKMAGQAGRSADKVKAYQEALTLASQPGEKRLVLTGLGDVSNPDALKAVEPFLDDATLQREAYMAYEKIAESLVGKSPAAAKEALQRVADKATDAGMRNKAKQALDKIK